MKNEVTGGMSEEEIKRALLERACKNLMKQAGYVAPVTCEEEIWCDDKHFFPAPKNGGTNAFTIVYRNGDMVARINWHYWFGTLFPKSQIEFTDGLLPLVQKIKKPYTENDY